MVEPFIGTIQAFGFYFAPSGWMTCQGQLLSIAQYSTLYALIGTYYGGNGQTTFGLPNLAGRSVVGQGNGGAIGSYDMGEMTGNITTTLTMPNMPAHTHGGTVSGGSAMVSIPAYEEGGNEPAPAAGTILAASPKQIYSTSNSTTNLLPFNAPLRSMTGSTGVAGANMPLTIQNPYLVINYSIAIEGIFPSRN